MKMQKMQCFRGFISAVAIIFLLWVQPAFSSDIRISVLGDVVGNGIAEMKTAFNKWIPISGKAYPVIDGVNLRSKDGTMSLIFRDGARMEVGRNSDIVINGSKGNYTISMSGGKMAFNAPQGVSLSVETPNSTVQTERFHKVNFTAQENTRAVVIYDGKGTKVTVVSGALMVKDNAGAGFRTVSAGNAVYVADAAGGSRITPVQLADNTGGSGVLPGNPGNPGTPGIGGLGAAVGTEVGTFLIVNSNTNNKKASPSSP